MLDDEGGNSGARPELHSLLDLWISGVEQGRENLSCTGLVHEDVATPIGPLGLQNPNSGAAVISADSVDAAVAASPYVHPHMVGVLQLKKSNA